MQEFQLALGSGRGLENNPQRTLLNHYTDVDPWAQYEKIRVLGDGVSGTVYEAKKKDTGEVVALKSCKEAKSQLTYLLREINLLAALVSRGE